MVKLTKLLPSFFEKSFVAGWPEHANKPVDCDCHQKHDRSVTTTEIGESLKSGCEGIISKRPTQKSL